MSTARQAIHTRTKPTSYAASDNDSEMDFVDEDDSDGMLIEEEDASSQLTFSWGGGAKNLTIPFRYNIWWVTGRKIIVIF